MHLLEIGMGCSVHGGVDGLNTLSVNLTAESCPWRTLHTVQQVLLPELHVAC